MNEICWLPELEYLAQYENIWSIYESALYSIFKSDFIRKLQVQVGHLHGRT